MIPFSVLDLAPITEGGDAALALQRSRDLARHAERWGYKRFWLAEHHNMPGIASAATAVAICHVAGGTKTIRVGAGGIMLPNHAPHAQQRPRRLPPGCDRAHGLFRRSTARPARAGGAGRRPESADLDPGLQ